MKNKIDIKGIESLVQKIAKDEGSQAIFGLGKTSTGFSVPRWKTGLVDFDNMLGGGIPEGRVIEIFGAESSGKTTLSYYLCSRHPVCLYVPIEGTFDKGRARLFGNRPKQMLVYNRAKYGEQAFNRMIQFAEKGIPLEVLDSVPYMQRKQDVDKVLKAAHNNKVEALGVGGIACLMNDYLPSLKEVIEVSGTTVIFVNQMRDNVGYFGYGEQTHTPGGHQLKHTASIRIRIARKEWITIPNYDPMSPAKDEKIGLIMKCRTEKNKTFDPHRECELVLIFSIGFIDYADLEETRKNIMKERREYFKGIQ